MSEKNESNPKPRSEFKKFMINLSRSFLHGYLAGMCLYFYSKFLNKGCVKPGFYFRPKFYTSGLGLGAFFLKGPIYDAVIPKLPGFRGRFKSQYVTLFYSILIYPLYFILVPGIGSISYFFTKAGLQFVAQSSFLQIILLWLKKTFNDYRLCVVDQTIRVVFETLGGYYVPKLIKRPSNRILAMLYDTALNVTIAFVYPVFALPIDQYISGVGWDMLLDKCIDKAVIMIPVTVFSNIVGWIFSAVGIY